ncbi:glutaminyl-tRNA synthetase [Saccharicrinis carchari]|uniref:Glutamine--tRNA ligase n=1 Tax=Saccharicrinis carchari TaxID=1168039 RepID=A0A521D977_SACCC|nr:glutamine--tRNA ligase/YqeY domain fusion protein [Saccharicrinis carchari]SMO67440.1 glutaminyl-tRNA synthetase [Saccharicrinis carchari]
MNTKHAENNPEMVKSNFIHQEIDKDLAKNINDGVVLTRFPPEPNGYLHIGHAKSICLNFGLAQKYGGACNLRFDDTNPLKEDVEYVDSIMEDVRWLGFEWEGEEKYASDYFQQLYDWAVKLIKNGKAYVDDQSAEDIARQKGTPTQAGAESPCRNRPVQENLDLFERMKNGEFAAGRKVLRAKIDMASPNMHMRDPLMYRIIHSSHHRTGDDWCIYPMYDFAHGQEDFIEGITHSVCTLEFEVHRPLYNWFLDQIIEGDKDLMSRPRPRQIEFARLNLNYTVMSKRKLLELVEKEIVDGWDDPRMPTVSGLRRRGYTPESIRTFADKVGVARRDGVIDVALLESCVRDDLNKRVARVNAVIDPVKLIITNYPEGQEEWVEIENNPEDEAMGIRKLPFAREVYIERDDFMEDPPRKFFRLGPGREVRLKGAYAVTCTDYKKNANGEIEEIYCTYDPETKSGATTVSRKIKGILHWVAVNHALDAEVRMYDRLYNHEAPASQKDADHIDFINPDSLKVITAKVEPSLRDASVLDKFQFQRVGYFCVDRESTPQKLVFNRTVALRDSWAKKN